MSTPVVAVITLSAVAEVRDADGNLISAEPVDAEFPVTQDELDQLMEGQA